ncbi:hypothetical protein D3C86_848580 [compost metagenome]
MACPPPAISTPSFHAACTARPRFMPGCDRPEPLPTPLMASTPMTMTGFRQRSRKRPATMPTTPGCQSSPETTTSADSSACAPVASTRRTACSVT